MNTNYVSEQRHICDLCWWTAVCSLTSTNWNVNKCLQSFQA